MEKIMVQLEQKLAVRKVIHAAQDSSTCTQLTSLKFSKAKEFF